MDKSSSNINQAFLEIEREMNERDNIVFGGRRPFPPSQIITNNDNVKANNRIINNSSANGGGTEGNGQEEGGGNQQQQENGGGGRIANDQEGGEQLNCRQRMDIGNKNRGEEGGGDNHQNGNDTGQHDCVSCDRPFVPEQAKQGHHEAGGGGGYSQYDRRWQWDLQNVLLLAILMVVGSQLTIFLAMMGKAAGY